MERGNWHGTTDLPCTECYREGGYGVRNYRHTEEKWMKKRRKQLSTG